MDLCRVEFRLAERKPHDDFCGLLPIGVDPQIEIGDNGLERLIEDDGCFRFEGSAFV
jgi:hypothetical protein